MGEVSEARKVIETRYLPVHDPAKEKLTAEMISADIGRDIKTVRKAMRYIRKAGERMLMTAPGDHEKNGEIFVVKKEAMRTLGKYLIQPETFKSAYWVEPTREQYLAYKAGVGKFFAEIIDKAVIQPTIAIGYDANRLISADNTLLSALEDLSQKPKNKPKEKS